MEENRDSPALRHLVIGKEVPLSVGREASLRHAETKMLLHDYSQLPVITGTRTVHGIVSWKSIGRAHVAGSAGVQVAQCMDTDVRVLLDDMPLLKAVDEIIQHEVVLVRDPAKKIVGIVTTTDLSERLRDLTDAFLLVGNIERQIRRLIGNRIPLPVLRSFVAPESKRDVNGIEDLSFGEYLRVLQVTENWGTLGLKVDAEVVLKRLEQVRTIRNAVMHFRADSLTSVDLRGLRLTEAFLSRLRPKQTQPF